MGGLGEYVTVVTYLFGLVFFLSFSHPSDIRVLDNTQTTMDRLVDLIKKKCQHTMASHTCEHCPIVCA